MKDRVYFLDNLRTFLIFMVVLYHAGFVYQNTMQLNWIVLDPERNDAIGIIGLYADIFVMATIFFISGFFVPRSLKGKSNIEYIKSKFNRILLPWIVAVFTLIPLYKILFLYSRGLPQQEWYTYFHLYQRTGSDLSFFANNPSQHWLWFLPILFIFQIIYLGLSKTKLLQLNISLKSGVTLVFVVGVVYSMIMAVTGLKGWTLSPLLDFQRERLLIYFSFFLLGSLCYKLGVFEGSLNKKYFVISNVVLSVGIGVYTIVALNFLMNMISPERNYFFISQRIDGLTYYVFLLLLMLSFLHILLYTFKSRFNRTGSIMAELNKSSYHVYIIHMIVTGAIALILIKLNIPVIVKYLTLSLLTFMVSSLISVTYRKWFQQNSYLKTASISVFIIGFLLITVNGFSNQLRRSDSKVTMKKESGHIDLHEAVVTGDIEAVKEHIKAGSDLDQRENAGGSSPLITAATFGETEIAILLIQAGADINFKNYDGSTPLITAAFFCRKEIVKALLENGADKNIKNNSGSSALDAVSSPFENVKGIYEYFNNTYSTLGLSLDFNYLEKTRPEIVDMLTH